MPDPAGPDLNSRRFHLSCPNDDAKHGGRACIRAADDVLTLRDGGFDQCFLEPFEVIELPPASATRDGGFFQRSDSPASALSYMPVRRSHSASPRATEPGRCSKVQPGGAAIHRREQTGLEE
jgi:hypothetical protein